MKVPTNKWMKLVFQFAAFLLAMLFVVLILWVAGAPPLKPLYQIVIGAVGSMNKISNVLVAWAPLMLAATGVLITFTAGLWNIGIEGQITLGAVFTTWALRLLMNSSLPPAVIIILSILAGMLGGALWAVLAGLLKTFGGVNEIFGGLGLNFVATALTLFLIFGPWKRPGTGSMSGTEPFDRSLWLPEVPGLRLSLWTLFIAIVGIILVYYLLKGTYFGLKLKAIGSNIKASYRLGVPTWQYMLISFALCGVFAGLAGAVQVTAVYHRLIPSISSGYGFLGLLVAMLVSYRAAWVAPVALFFAALNIGSIQLPIVLKLDSSLSGVIQGTLVLFFLLMQGVQQRFGSRE